MLQRHAKTDDKLKSVWETTACQLVKGEWKFGWRVRSTLYLPVWRVTVVR